MDKDTTWDARDFRQLAVPHTPPRFGEGFAVDKGVGGLGNTLDAPFGRRFRFGVKDVEDRGGSLRKGGLKGEKVVFPWARLAKCLAFVIDQETWNYRPCQRQRWHRWDALPSAFSRLLPRYPELATKQKQSSLAAKGTLRLLSWKQSRIFAMVRLIMSILF